MKFTTVIIMSLLITSHQLVAQDVAEDDETVQPRTTKSTEPEYELLEQINLPPADATSITVIVEKKQTIEEYRQNGELVMVKVIPNKGASYYIDPLERDNLNDSGRELINSGVKPVRWVIKEF